MKTAMPHRRWRARLVLSSLALCALGSASRAMAFGWPEIEPPPQSHVVWVGQDMKINGVPLRVQQFDSSLAADDVLTFYRAHWGSRQERKSVENKRGDFSVIGRKEGDYYLTVEVKNSARSGSEGFLSVSRLPGVDKPDMSPGELPMNSGSKVLWVMDSSDAGKSSKQVTLFNRDSVKSNVLYYDNALLTRGWTKKQESSAKNVPDESTLTSYAKDKEELTLEIIRKQGSVATLVVSNLVTLH